MHEQPREAEVGYEGGGRPMNRKHLFGLAIALKPRCS
jgi:hypothetical protein